MDWRHDLFPGRIYIVCIINQNNSCMDHTSAKSARNVAVEIRGVKKELEIWRVQVYADPLEMGVPVCEVMQRCASIPGSLNGYFYKCRVNTARPHTDFTPLIVAYHPDAYIPAENNLVQWWSGAAELHRNSQ